MLNGENKGEVKIKQNKMEDKKEEVVLALTKEAFDKSGAFNGYKSLKGKSILRDWLTNSGDTAYLPRAAAETDKAHKQLIPYIAVMCEDEVLVYERGEAGGEERLHSQLSIGIGGHVNTDDDPSDPFFTFSKGALREIREEIGIEVTHTEFQKSIYGLVNDSESHVGAVHLGVACVIRVKPEQKAAILAKCEEAITNPKFVPITELENPELFDKLETWSKYFAQGYIVETSELGKWNNEGFRERVTMLSITASALAASASGMLLGRTPATHLAAKAEVEEGAGEVQCLLAGLIYNQDISSDEIKTSAKEFQKVIHDVMKYQAEDEEG